MIDIDPIFPWFLSHSLNQPFQPLRTCLIKFQCVIFCLTVNLQFSLTIKREIFVVKCVHTDSNRPYVTRLTRKTIFSLELVFRSSKSWSSRREKWNIILIVSDCCEISQFNFMNLFRSFSTQNIVDFDVTVGYLMAVKVLDSWANLGKNYPCDVIKFSNLILWLNVINNFFVPDIIGLEFIPFHYLAHGTHFMD